MHQAEIRQRIDGELADRNLTYAALAARMGVSRSYVTQLMRGDRTITLEALSSILQAITRKSPDPARWLMRAHKLLK